MGSTSLQVEAGPHVLTLKHPVRTESMQITVPANGSVSRTFSAVKH